MVLEVLLTLDSGTIKTDTQEQRPSIGATAAPTKHQINVNIGLLMVYLRAACCGNPACLPIPCLHGRSEERARVSNAAL